MKQNELNEQAKVVQYCRDNGIMVMGTAQSTYTESWAAINRNIKAGVTKGFPDLCIIIPAKYRKDDKRCVVFLEMKKADGGVVSPQQQQWINALNECNGVSATVSYGAEQAIAFIESFIQIRPPLPEPTEEFIKNL